MKTYGVIVTAAVALAAASLALMVGALLGFWYYQASVDKIAYNNCRQIEELKSIGREQAQATVDGDNLLLYRNKTFGDPLPVPRRAVLDDRNAKFATVNRLAAKPCKKP